MLDGFKKIKLSTGVPFVSITDNGTAFNKSVVVKLGEPTHICLLFNEETKELAIQACDENEEGSIPFLRDKNKLQNGVRFNNRDLQNELAATLKWDISNYNYRTDGRYLSDEKAMVFDLKTARTLSKKNMRQK